MAAGAEPVFVGVDVAGNGFSVTMDDVGKLVDWVLDGKVVVGVVGLGVSEFPD